MNASRAGVTLITGSNGGMGSNLVGYLLESGDRNIVCHYRGSGDRVRKVLEANGMDVERHLVHADLTNEDEVRALHEEVQQRFGCVWGIVNLAGASTNAVSWKLSVADFRRVLDANLLTTFLTVREFIPEMRAAGRGRIINISSVVAHVGAFGASHYAAAKSAVLGLTRSLAIELVSKNITVNALSLGYFEYGMINDVPGPELEQIRSRIPMNRLGRVNELGGMIRFLLNEDSSYVTGQSIHINGGQFM